MMNNTTARDAAIAHMVANFREDELFDTMRPRTRRTTTLPKSTTPAIIRPGTTLFPPVANPPAVDSRLPADRYTFISRFMRTSGNLPPHEIHFINHLTATVGPDNLTNMEYVNRTVAYSIKYRRDARKAAQRIAAL